MLNYNPKWHPCQVKEKGTVKTVPFDERISLRPV